MSTKQQQHGFIGVFWDGSNTTTTILRRTTQEVLDDLIALEVEAFGESSDMDYWNYSIRKISISDFIAKQ